MERTPEGWRIVDGMVELPRNPVDEKIDRLSPTAVKTITSWSMGDGMPSKQSYSAVTPWMRELLDAELVEEIKGEFDPCGNQVRWQLNLTFDGWNAKERIDCGMYAHHKQIEQDRTSRDAAIIADQAAMEAHPSYGQF